jgi:hypothetical protein
MLNTPVALTSTFTGRDRAEPFALIAFAQYWPVSVTLALEIE